MRIAVLGATSQMARDLVRAMSFSAAHELTLLARRPDAVRAWLATLPNGSLYAVNDLGGLQRDAGFDAIINFVGVANPASTAALGSKILDLTRSIDDMAMAYIEQHENCKYLFLSSGAVYATSFDEPATAQTCIALPINSLGAEHWYGLAKFIAEARHRAASNLAIVDLRVFSYVSRYQDMDARFLITDAVRALRSKQTLLCAASQNSRDYLHPSDFHALVECVLSHAPMNTSLDCYTRMPVEKWTLLNALRDEFGLSCAVVETGAGVNATGLKPMYYSLDRRAAAFGYAPSLDSLGAVLEEVGAYLAENKR